MEKARHILEEVEKTLRALDGMPKLDANPFLFTRIQARLASQPAPEKPYWLKHMRLKPIALALIVIMNIVTALHVLGTNRREYSKEQLVYSLSKDYDSLQNDFLMGN